MRSYMPLAFGSADGPVRHAERWRPDRPGQQYWRVTSDLPVIALTYNAEVDAAYIRMQPEDSAQPSVAETLTVNADINLDFDHAGHLVGIEILAARRVLHPALLREVRE